MPIISTVVRRRIERGFVSNFFEKPSQSNAVQTDVTHIFDKMISVFWEAASLFQFIHFTPPALHDAYHLSKLIGRAAQQPRFSISVLANTLSESMTNHLDAGQNSIDERFHDRNQNISKIAKQNTKIYIRNCRPAQLNCDIVVKNKVFMKVQAQR